MGQVKVSGSIIAGPTVSGDDVFPGGSANLALTTTPNPKPFQVATGSIPRNLQSPNAYVSLSGVGETDTVIQGNFLFVRCTSPMWLRLTFDALPADIVSEIPVQGEMMIELPATNPLVLLEAKGSGFLEYFVSGNQ